MKATEAARKERIVTHEQARESAMKFINAHFRNYGRDRPTATVPPQLEDDDIVLIDYIKQQEAKDLERQALVQLVFALATEFGQDEYNRRIAPLVRKYAP